MIIPSLRSILANINFNKPLQVYGHYPEELPIPKKGKAETVFFGWWLKEEKISSKFFEELREQLPQKGKIVVINYENPKEEKAIKKALEEADFWIIKLQRFRELPDKKGYVIIAQKMF